jgi:hypothetical protein
MSGRSWNWLDQTALVLVAALFYYFSYLSSYQLSAHYEFSHATSWVYLPSGVRLLLVLVLMEAGAIGIFLGTLSIDYFFNLSLNHTYNWVTAMVAGTSAYLSLRIAQFVFGFNRELSRLTPKHLTGVCVVFSLVSPLMHQSWYAIHGETVSFWKSMLVMSVGDLGGSLIVLCALHAVIRAWRFVRA